jgi:drug/metabolite transporter (DMT)-like permease
MPAGPHGTAAPAGFADPYVQIAIGAVLVTASELLLKAGAVATAPAEAALFGIGALASWWTWAGILTYVLSFASWLHVLRHMPLAQAFALINAVHVLVPVGSWLILGETVSLQRWAGIAAILAGIILVAQNAAAAEERL